ncbi:MAG: PAS domain-containing protein, partial [Deltaproteobacteria bacterium]|nr:PAS domain-containing protein [Deltaproteobacteria bacterium]
ANSDEIRATQSANTLNLEKITLSDRHWGYTPSELLSGAVKYDRIIHPDDLERVTREVDFFNRQADLKNFVHEPYRIVSSKGETRWVEDRTYLRRNESGDITHYRGVLIDITNRIALEQALRQSEERLAMALAGANEGIWDWDLSTDNVYFDSGYYRMAGYPPNDFPSTFTEWNKRIHKDDVAQVNATLSDYLAGSLESYEVEFRFLRKDGSYMWILAKGKTVAGDTPKYPTRFLGTHIDITLRKQMEQALLNSESRLSEAQKLAGLGYWDWNISTGEVTWSDEVFKIFHLDPSSFTPQIDSIMQLSPWPEYQNRHEELIQRSIEKKEKGSYDQKFLRPDGSIGYYSSSFKGEYDSDGNLTSMHGTVMDITERKIQESELKRLRNYLGNIIDSMPSILITVDGDCNVTQWNSQAAQATGLSFEAARTRPLETVFPRFATEMETVRKSIRERRVITVPRIEHTLAKETHFDAITIYPLIAEGDDGAVIRVDDVTEQVHMEEMMIQSEKMLSVGGLAAGMAHEINNPLAGMLQTANVMRTRLENLELPANIRAAEEVGVSPLEIKRFMEKRNIFRMLDTIDKSGKWMASIVENMLNFARKSTTRIAPNAMEELLDKTVELAATDYDLKKQYSFKTIEIKREYANAKTIVPCEGASIQQVFLNIFRNGAQAMMKHGTQAPHFILRTRTDLAKGVAIIEIEDNGPGMDAQSRTRIFEPFYTTRSPGVGTGLGLSVSYFIITDNHHGSLTVESNRGAGAKFVIQLPLTPAKAA